MTQSTQRLRSPTSVGDVLPRSRDPSIVYRVGSARSDSSREDGWVRNNRVATFMEHPSQRIPLKSAPKATSIFAQLRAPQKLYPSCTSDRSATSNIPDFEVVPGLKITDQAALINHQAVFVDFSAQDQEVYKVMRSRTTFLDAYFPPGDKSLFGKMTSVEKRYTQRKQQLVWRRISEVVWNAGLFNDGIHPNNIHQGEFGTAYLLLALSALAERPQRIRDLFLAKEVCQQGVFACSLLFRGRWKSLYLDNFMPVPR